ncbi:MAG: GNAT family N-acetyltransferase [Novosphingobium sp.]
MNDDLDRIMAVMQAAFDPLYGEAWTRRQVEDALLIGNCHYLLAGEDGEDPRDGGPNLGFALSRPGFEEEELLLFAVDPAHRGKGVGSRLLARFGRAAKARGAQQLLLEMRRGNPAERLYRAYGFAPIGERPKYYRQSDGVRTDAITFSCPADRI